MTMEARILRFLEAGGPAWGKYEALPFIATKLANLAITNVLASL